MTLNIKSTAGRAGTAFRKWMPSIAAFGALCTMLGIWSLLGTIAHKTERAYAAPEREDKHEHQDSLQFTAIFDSMHEVSMKQDALISAHVHDSIQQAEHWALADGNFKSISRSLSNIHIWQELPSTRSGAHASAQ